MKCKLCNKDFKSLVYHLKYTHNINPKDYKIKFNVNLIQEPVNSGVKTLQKCPYCDYINMSVGKRGLSLHIMYKHKDKFNEWKSKKIQNDFQIEYITCPICNKKVRNLRQHILWHNITWENFCIKYNWDKNNKAIFSTIHKKHLHDNKLNFYRNTIEGDNLKREQSLKISGKNNPACKKEVREKISQARVKNNDKYKFNTYGTIIKFKNGDICRSLQELKFKYLLDINNIIYKYEKLNVIYEINNIKRIYISDFVINNNVIEIKGDNSTLLNCKQKYKLINERLKLMNYNFYYNNPIDFFKNNNINIQYNSLNDININIVLEYYINNIKCIKSNNKNFKLFKNEYFKSKFKIEYFGKKEK